MASLGLNELKKMGSLRHPKWYYLNKIKEPAHMVKNNSRKNLPILRTVKESHQFQNKIPLFLQGHFQKFPDL